MLLVWARGVVFARLNNMQIVCSSWWGFRWGALLRRENKKRLYWKYFNESPLPAKLTAWYYRLFRNTVTEPEIAILPDPDRQKDRLYLFNTVMTDPDLFGSIRDHQKLIAEKIYDSLHPSKTTALLKYEPPVIGIHIRRGDFKLGSTITPLSYFINAIDLIRETAGQVWPVTVFTDAEKEEIQELLALPGIKVAEEKADILDILLFSKSKVLVLSAGSTFSYWAAFLSNGFVIRPENDWLKGIKAPAGNGYFEMKYQSHDADSSRDLKENLAAFLKNMHEH